MRQTSRHRRRRSTAAAAGRMIELVWIARGTRLEVSKLGGHSFSNYQSASLFQLGHNCRFFSGK